ncbi:immunoglobulin-like domain-containing protein [Ureibacillus xyleni]|nr:immunoglobulin-like domain-containing protein [Ureibacillus xyleni]
MGLSFIVPVTKVAAEGGLKSLDLTDFAEGESKLIFPEDTTKDNVAKIENKALVLTPSEENKFGMAMTKEPLTLPEDYSFSTNFSFSVTDLKNFGADGIFYILQSESKPPLEQRSGAGAGGNVTNGLMLEFRTWVDTGHLPNYIKIWSGTEELGKIDLGIDDYFASSSSNEIPFYVWLDYDGTGKTLKLYLSKNNKNKPANPMWTGTNISLGGDAFKSHDLYGAFSAYTGWGYEKHKILSWNIDTSGLGTVANTLQIGYKESDSATSVTQDLSLPSTLGDNIQVTWKTSNPSIISAEGIVSRPTTADTIVTLTATITGQSSTVTKTFPLTVKKVPVFKGDELAYDQVGPSKVSSFSAIKTLTVLGRGFKGSEISKYDFRFKAKHVATETVYEIAPDKITIQNDNTLRIELPKEMKLGYYDLDLQHKFISGKKVTNAFEVTEDPKYKNRMFSEVVFKANNPTNQDVDEVKLKGPFEESSKGVYELADPKEVVTMNGYVMFKGSELKVDQMLGKVRGNGRLYVNGRSQNGITTTYTLHEGSFEIDAEEFRIKFNASSAYDFLKLSMPVGIQSMQFVENGLRVKGEIQSNFRLGSAKLNGKANVEGLDFTPSGVDLAAQFSMGVDLKTGPLKSSELRVGIDTKKSKFGIGASAEIRKMNKGFDLDLVIVRGQLDTVKIAVVAPIKIGTTGAQIKKIGGGISGLSSGAEAPLTLHLLGGLSDVITPKINDQYMINADDLELGLSGAHVEFKGNLAIYTIKIAEVEAKVVFNPVGYPGFTKAGFKLDARVDILGILIGTFNVQYFEGETFKGYVMSRVIVPTYVPIIGGNTLSKASLGVDDSKVRGSLEVIGVGFVATYGFSDSKVDFKVDALATLKNIGKFALGAVTGTVKAISSAATTVWNGAKTVANGVAKAASSIGNAVASGAKTVFKKLKFWSAPVYFANGESIDDPALLEALQDLSGEVNVVSISVDDPQRLLIEVSDVTSAELIHVQSVTANNGSIVPLVYDTSDPNWNAIFKADEHKVYFYVDVPDKNTTVEIASEDGSVVGETVQSYKIDSTYNMQQIQETYIVEGHEMPFTVSEESDLALVLDYITDTSNLKIIRPDGSQYKLEFDSNSGNWNASIVSTEKVVVKIPSAEVGNWKIFNSEVMEPKFFEIDENASMTDLIVKAKYSDYQLQGYNFENGQTYIQIQNSSNDIVLLKQDGTAFPLDSNQQSENWNSYYDDDTNTTHILLNVLQNEVITIGTKNDATIQFYELNPSVTNLKPLFENPNQGNKTFFEIKDPGRYLFDITDGDSTAEIIRPNGDKVIKILDDKDSNHNALYRSDEKHMYITVDVDANQVGEYIVETKSITQTVVTQVNPLPKITEFNATKANGENTFDFTWNIEHPRAGSNINLMLTTSEDQLVGPTIASGLGATGNKEVSIPRSIMSGKYYVVLETHHEDIGPRYEVLDTPIEVSWADAPKAPTDLNVLSTSNGQITLEFKDSNSADMSYYRVHQVKNGVVDYFGPNYEVEADKTKPDQKIIISGLETGKKYSLVVSAIKEVGTTGEVSLPSEVVEVNLPVPNYPKVNLSIAAPDGTKKKNFKEIVYNDVEETMTIIDKTSATVDINVDQSSTIEIYVNEQLVKTEVGTDVQYELENLVDRDYFIDVRVANEQGDQGRAYQTLYVDTQAPMLQLNHAPGDIMNSEEIQIQGQTDIGATLTVNGKTVDTDERGYFTYVHQYQGDDRSDIVEFVVTDTVGNKTEHALELLMGPGLRAERYSKYLQTLNVSAVVLSPKFNMITTEYNAGNVTQANVRIQTKAFNSNTKLRIKDGQSQVGLLDTTVPLTMGKNTIIIEVLNSNDQVVNQYSIMFNRINVEVPSSGNNPGGSQEVITVPVEAGGNGSGSGTVSTAEIVRTTTTTGAKKDEVTYTQQKAVETVQKLKEAGSDTARIVIPDAKDEVAQADIKIEKASIQAFEQGKINLEISTDNARIILPAESMKNMNEDLYFKVVPIKERAQQQQKENQVRTEEVVKKVAGNQTVNVVGRPMTIETNMTSRSVDLVLPLRDVSIPTDAAERQAFLSKLGIFIEHSDGEKVLVKGDVVTYKDGQLGLKITINKFSTFTIVEMENGWTTPETDSNGRTMVSEKPVMVDKTWTIKLSAPVKPSTVTKENVYVVDEEGNRVEVYLELSKDNRSIIVKPQSYYKPNQSYQLVISKKVQSMDGKPIKEAIQFKFQTTSYSLDVGKLNEHTEVPVNKEWTINFNSKIDIQLISKNSVIVTNKYGDQMDIDVKPISSYAFQVIPKVPYLRGESYYLFVKDIKSQQGKTLTTPTWIKFTVAE